MSCLTREFVSAFMDRRGHRLRRTCHDAPHVHILLLKPDPAGADARDFQQIIHKMCELPHLTLDDSPRLLLDRALRFRNQCEVNERRS